MSEDRCGCTCGLPGCASRPGSTRRVGLTLHGTNKGYENGCECDACRDAHSRSTLKQRKRLNEQTRASATKARQEWTGPELELATRPGLTAREAAELLGRSMQAVKNVRHKCQHDPKYIALLDGPRA